MARGASFTLQLRDRPAAGKARIRPDGEKNPGAGWLRRANDDGRDLVINVPKSFEPEELTNDYATSTAEPAFTMNCACGSPLCRGTVTGDDWRRRELQRRYAGWFSRYLSDRIGSSAS